VRRPRVRPRQPGTREAPGPRPAGTTTGVRGARCNGPGRASDPRAGSAARGLSCAPSGGMAGRSGAPRGERAFAERAPRLASAAVGAPPGAPLPSLCEGEETGNGAPVPAKQHGRRSVGCRTFGSDGWMHRDATGSHPSPCGEGRSTRERSEPRAGWGYSLNAKSSAAKVIRPHPDRLRYARRSTLPTRGRVTPQQVVRKKRASGEVSGSAMPAPQRPAPSSLIHRRLSGHIPALWGLGTQPT